MSIEINGPSKPIVGDALKIDNKNDNDNDDAKANAAAEAKAGNAADSVNLTKSGIKLNELEHSVAEGPDVNQQRVEAIKKAIAAGTYNVDADKIAKKLTTLESLLP